MSHLTAMLLRRRDAAAVLSVSESQVLRWERQGLLTPIPVPGLRMIRYDASQVSELARRIVSSVAAPATAGDV